MSAQSSSRLLATGFAIFACTLLAAAGSPAQDFVVPANIAESFEASGEVAEPLRYDFFPAALSCPVTQGMDTVGGRFFEKGAIVSQPFKPYFVCNGIDLLDTLPSLSFTCDAYCPIPRSERRTPASLAKLEVQLRDESQNSNRVVSLSVCGQNHVGETVCASVAKSPPADPGTPHQIVSIDGADLDPVRQLPDAYTLYLHFHQESGFGAQPMDFVNWAVYWDEN